MRQFADAARELFGVLVDVFFSDMTCVERCLSDFLHNGLKCGGKYGVGEHWDSVDVSKYIGTQLPEEYVAQSLTFPVAVHILDWNHIIMNTLRNACKAIECWPRFLARMRSLTNCFRNEDYRCAIQVYLQTLGQGVQRFGVWRYETMCEVVCCFVHASCQSSQTMGRWMQLP